MTLRVWRVPVGGNSIVHPQCSSRQRRIPLNLRLFILYGIYNASVKMLCGDSVVPDLPLNPSNQDHGFPFVSQWVKLTNVWRFGKGVKRLHIPRKLSSWTPGRHRASTLKKQWLEVGEQHHLVHLQGTTTMAIRWDTSINFVTSSFKVRTPETRSGSSD